MNKWPFCRTVMGLNVRWVTRKCTTSSSTWSLVGRWSIRVSSLPGFSKRRWTVDWDRLLASYSSTIGAFVESDHSHLLSLPPLSTFPWWCDLLSWPCSQLPHLFPPAQVSSVSCLPDVLPDVSQAPLTQHATPGWLFFSLLTLLGCPSPTHLPHSDPAVCFFFSSSPATSPLPGTVGLIPATFMLFFFSHLGYSCLLDPVHIPLSNVKSLKIL